jgi:PAS domain S-box-containing protein
MFKTIQVKLSLSFLALIVCLAIALGLSAYILIKKHLGTIYRSELELFADHVSDDLTHLIHMRKEILKRITEGPDFINFHINYRELALIAHFAKFRNDFPVLSFISEEGSEEVKVVQGESSEALHDYSDSRLFQKTVWNPDEVIIAPYYSLDGAEPVITMTMARHGYFGDEFQGMIMGQFPFSVLSDELAKIKLGGEGSLILVDNQGRVLAHSLTDRADSTVLNLPEGFIERLNTSKKGFKRIMISGTDSFTAYAPLAGANWYLLASLPYTEFVGAANKLLRVAGFILFIAAVCAIFSSFIISRKITSPLMSMASSTRKITDGDFSHKVEIVREDEIGTLAQTFNAMIDALQESRSKLIAAKNNMENITASMMNALIVMDSDLKIINVNKATCELLGYEEKELLHKPFSAVVGNDEWSRLKQELLAKQVISDMGAMYVTYDGKEIPVIITFSTIKDKEGLIKGVVSVAQDISELRSAYELLQKSHDKLELKVKDRTRELEEINEQLHAEIEERNRAEAELRDSAEKLEESNIEIQDFLHIASHDLQEPVRKVMTLGDRLMEKHADTLDEKGRDYLERMQRASKRMRRLIDSLISYSRVRTRAKPFTPVDLTRVIKEVVAELGAEFAQAGGNVEVGDLLTIDADIQQVRYMFQNLIENALKYRKEDDLLKVKIYGELLASDEDGSGDGESSERYYQFTVQDNGIGFNEKYAERIFTVFQRLHGRNEYEGTGIGLSICKKIVERHGGSIRAESSPGQGSSFIVKLPVRHVSA